MVCASGVRSAKAVSQLKALGCDNAQSLRGGLSAWRAANLPLKRPEASGHKPPQIGRASRPPDNTGQQPFCPVFHFQAMQSVKMYTTLVCPYCQRARPCCNSVG